MKQIFAGATAASLAALAPLSAAAQNLGYENHPHGWGGGWGYMLFGPLTMIVAVVVIVVLAVLAVRWLDPSGAAPTASRSAKSPLDILKERFARGEIDKAEFEERQQCWKASPPRLGWHPGYRSPDPSRRR